MTYLTFLRENARLALFGLLLTFCSSFGQTFYIALYGAEIRGTFDLGHGAFGSIYSLATLGGGILLIGIGRQIDRVDLRLYATLAGLGLAAGCLGLALAPAAWLLVPVLLVLRLAGQGLMSHISVTAMARYVPQARGKAIAFAALGLPIAEATLPVLAVSSTAVLGWRGNWLLAAALMSVLFPIASRMLLAGQDERHARFLEGAARAADRGERSWSRREVLRDPLFWILMPALLAPSFIITGLFLHQVHLVEAKSWTLAWFASCFAGYAIASVTASLVMGPLVDRRGALRVLPFYLWPQAIGLAALTASDHPLVALVFLVGAGATAGSSMTVQGAMWAELYGSVHIGAIRALATSFAVITSASAPASMGWLFDGGVAIETVTGACLVWTLLGIVLLVHVRRRRSRPRMVG